MSTFEERLGAAIDEIMHYQTADNGRINTGTIAATLIAQGVVADPVQHQQDLTAIMDRQVREAEAWRDEYITSYDDPADLDPEEIARMTIADPAWPSAQDFAIVYRRRVTDWQEVHRA